MMEKKLTILLLMVAGLCSSQSFNQLDSAGKRHGKWIIYLDNNWKRIDDSAKASFKRISYFDHGVHVYPMGPCGKKGYKLEHSSTNESKIPLLDGEYRWHDEKCNVTSVHVFNKGEYVSCKEYSSGRLQQFFDYSKKCEGQDESWSVFIYDKKGQQKHAYCVCKDKQGRWPKMRD